MQEEKELTMEEEEKRRADLEKAAQLARLQELEDVRYIAGSDAGIRFFKRMVKISGIFSSSFRADDTAIEFREGMRNMGLLIMGDLAMAAPDKMAVVFSRDQGGEK